MLRILKRLFGKKKDAEQCSADPLREENYQPKKEVDKEEEWENLKYIQIYGTTTKELAESVQRCIESMNNFNSAVNGVMPNNWLKMHGKPMRRRCGRRKRNGR